MRRCPASLSQLLRPRYRGTLQLVQYCRPGRCDRWRQHGHLATNATLSSHDIPPKSTLESKTRQRTPSAGEETGYTPKSLISRVLKCLPARYRSGAHEASNDDINAVGSAKLLRQLVSAGSMMTPKIDVLYELAVVRGQWKGAVWIVQQILSSADVKTLSISQWEGLVLQNHDGPKLNNLTDSSPSNELVDEFYHTSSGTESQMDARLIRKQLKKPNSSKDDHPLLGCIWRSLGMMILACVRDESIAAGSVKPEVLEILALFHHHGLMPATIYNYVPSEQSSIVQQPAVLYLLSSRIMVALSDAAWRAREHAALADHQNTDPPRLELLSSAVRANIEAVRPEIWLELILWSCIHGRWVEPGSDVLVATCEEKHPRWRALSWRKTLKDYLGVENIATINWEEELTAFQLSRKAKHDPEILQLRHTLSSELVSVFVEAILTNGKSYNVQESLQQLETLRQFLRSSDLNMPDSTWDATILRIAENHEKVYTRTDLLFGLVGLSAGFGEELGSWDRLDKQWRSSHMFEGNATVLGLLHRGLRHQIDLGCLSRAVEVLNLIRSFVDEFHKKSLEDFFRSRTLDDQATGSSSDPSRMYFGGVEHPSFEPQIPLSTMASLLDLSTQLGAYELGASLINDEDIGTAMLPEHSWGSPEIASSLVRFATASKDDVLLAKVMKARDAELYKILDTNPSKTVMSNLLIETFVTRSWEAAKSVLLWKPLRYGHFVDPQCMAVLSAELLKLTHGSEDAEPARALFASLMARDITLRSTTPEYADEVQNILKIMSLVDEECSRIMDKREAHPSLYPPSVHNFNVILDAVAQTLGIEQAMDLLNSVTSFAQLDLSPSVASKDRTTLTGGRLYLRRYMQPNIATFVILLKTIVQGLSSTGVKKMDHNTQQMVECVVDGMFAIAQKTDHAAIDMVQREIRSVLINANAVLFEDQIMAILMRKASIA